MGVNGGEGRQGEEKEREGNEWREWKDVIEEDTQAGSLSFGQQLSMKGGFCCILAHIVIIVNVAMLFLSAVLDSHLVLHLCSITVLLSLSPQMVQVEITGLLPNTQYSVEVAGVNAVGTGEFSEESDPITTGGWNHRKWDPYILLQLVPFCEDCEAVM